MTQRGDAQQPAAGHYLLVIRQFCAFSHGTLCRLPLLPAAGRGSHHWCGNRPDIHLAVPSPRREKRVHPTRCFLRPASFYRPPGRAQPDRTRRVQHNRWVSGSPKRQLNLDNLRIALLVDHQACVEKTGVGKAFRRHAFHGWPDDTFHGALMNFIGYYRRGE